MFLRVILLSAGLAHLAPAQDLAVFDRFSGFWTGSGHFRGAPATVQYEWKRILAGKFVSLDYSVLDAKKAEVFSGLAIYHPAAKGYWHDSTGNVYSLAWRSDADTVTVDWGLPNGPSGRSTYRLLAAGEVEATDSIQLKDGAWREFAKYQVRRAAVSSVDRVTVAVQGMDRMVAFYNTAFEARLHPEGKLFRGRLGGMDLLLCPNSIAKVDAKQNRKQLTLRVADLDATLAAVRKAGGRVQDQASGMASVIDPDGNTIELVASRP